MNYKKVIVFGAHPDDEITMGGTIYKMSKNGTKVIVVTMTDGCEGYSEIEMKDKIVEVRKKEAEICDMILGISERIFLELPDMALVNNKDILKKCIEIIRKIKPDAIFTHGPGDRHRDHFNTCLITIEAVWQAGEPVSIELGEPWSTNYIYYYKGFSGGLPSIIIDITDVAEKKIEAQMSQKSQYRIFRKTEKDFIEEIEYIKKYRPKRFEQFWISDRVILNKFL